MKTEKYLNSIGEQIDLTVDVYTRPNLRSGDASEMLLFTGKDKLAAMFDDCVVCKKTKNIDLIYPERWLNFLELRALTLKIQKCFPLILKVYIKTHSVYIIQCVHKGHIRICDDSSKYSEIYDEKNIVNARYCDQYNNKPILPLTFVTPKFGE